MAFQNFDPQDDSMAEINIVPLVDVMLVLLIIFMVAAPLSIGGINVEVPKAATKSISLPHDRVILSMNKKGEFYIGKLSISDSNLKDKLTTIFQHKKNKTLHIRADQNLIYGKVVKAMSIAKRSGVQKIKMLTQPNGKSH